MARCQCKIKNDRNQISFIFFSAGFHRKLSISYLPHERKEYILAPSDTMSIFFNASINLFLIINTVVPLSCIQLDKKNFFYEKSNPKFAFLGGCICISLIFRGIDNNFDTELYLFNIFLFKYFPFTYNNYSTVYLLQFIYVNYLLHYIHFRRGR